MTSRQVTPMEEGDPSSAPSAAATAAAASAAEAATAPSTAVAAPKAARLTRVELGEASVTSLDEDGAAKAKFAHCSVVAEYDPEGMLLRLCGASGDSLQEFLVKRATEAARIGRRSVVFHLDVETVCVKMAREDSGRRLAQMVAEIRTGSGADSVFAARTEDSSAMQYFQFYGYLSQQQNMMQDYVRTSTYQRAILANMADFKDKVVLDVGAGSGILSFFAQQAGAKKVYAVEGSSIAKHAEQLVRANRLTDVIRVISGKIEEIELPEKVDVIVSEPMGYMLLNERMLETYLHAKKWLRPGGHMFPTRGDLHVAPFADEALYMEQINKVNFWYQDYFHGVNLGSLRNAALAEYFRQPIVDTFDVRICLAKTQRHIIDFLKAEETELHRIEIPLEFHITQSGTVHGLAFWFDVAFIGTGATVWLSTAPTEPLTHWYQVRCLLQQPILVKQGQVLNGKVIMSANMKQSYDVTIECGIVGTAVRSSNTLDLKNPYFRYTGVQPAPPPGENHASPSETYWSQVDMDGARQAVNLVNGMIVDGLGHVSLDSGTAATQQPGAAGMVVAQQGAAAAGVLNQPNIHQGSILSTGRRAGEVAAGGGGAAVAGGSRQSTGAGAQSGSTPTTPMSCANSLQLNQLIGGGVAPSLVNGSSPMAAAAAVAAAQQQMHHQQQQAAAAAAAAATGLNLSAGAAGVSPNLMIGDYVQTAAAAAVLGNATAQQQQQQPQASFRQ